MGRSLWTLLQRQLQEELEEEEYSTWFMPLRVRRDSDDELVLLVPNQRWLHTLEENYRPLIDRLIANIPGASFEVLFSLNEEEPPSAPVAPFEFSPKYRFS